MTSILEEFNELSVYLQKESSEVSLSAVHQLFDGLIAETPNLRQYIGSNAEINHDKCFESDVVKPQRGENISAAEARVAKLFKKVDDSSVLDDPYIGFVARILHNPDDSNKRRKVSARYFPTDHIDPTSNVCEHLFSRVKLVM